MLGTFIVRDFIAIAGEMRRFPASNENTGRSVRINLLLLLLSAKPEIVVPESDSSISFSKFPVSRHLLKLFYDE